MIKNQIKSVLKPFYHKIIGKLRDGLHLDEHSRLLTHIVAQNVELQNDVKTLQREINILNILIGGTEPRHGAGAFTLTPEDTTRDLVNILAPHRPDEVTIIQLLNTLGKDTFSNKNICLVGAGSAFLKKELESRGAAQITCIELNPMLMEANTFNSATTFYVYPSRIGSVNIPDNIDILFVAHPAVAAYLLKRKLFHISAKIKEKAYFLLTGDEEERNHLATLITGSGFTQTKAVPAGETMCFDYLELRKTPKHNKSEQNETVLYEATKMPSVA